MTKKLTLKSALSPEKLAELNKLKNLKRDTQQKRERDEKHKSLREVFKWFYTTFPAAFSRHTPKPLKVGIESEIFAKLPEDNEELSRRKVRLALKIYTRTLAYQKAILESEERIDLDGKAAGAIEPSHKEHALEWIAHKKAQKMGKNADSQTKSNR